MKSTIENYLCPGCIHGPGPDTCEKYLPDERGCDGHHPGTMILGRGTIALGLPNGFNRFGPRETDRVEIFASFEEMVGLQGNLLSIFSLPIWKFLDEQGNTIVRWYSPRTNVGWSTVILGDCRDKLTHAIELTDDQVEGMD